MENNSTYIDLKNMLEEEFDSSKNSASDFIELCSSLEELISEKKEAMQDLINSEVESLVDSFGGEDCTMRDLKGDL